MGKKTEKLKSSKVYFSLITLLFVFMFFLTVFGTNGLLDLRRLKQKQADVLTNIRVIKEENAQLYKKISRLKTDNKYIEELARKEFGMVKAGEIVFLFQD